MIPLPLNYLTWVCQIKSARMDRLKKKKITFSFTPSKRKHNPSSKTPHLGKTMGWLNINKGLYQKEYLPKTI